jgi:hypothetical protein
MKNEKILKRKADHQVTPAELHRILYGPKTERDEYSGGFFHFSGDNLFYHGEIRLSNLLRLLAIPSSGDLSGVSAESNGIGNRDSTSKCTVTGESCASESSFTSASKDDQEKTLRDRETTSDELSDPCTYYGDESDRYIRTRYSRRLIPCDPCYHTYQSQDSQDFSISGSSGEVIEISDDEDEGCSPGELHQSTSFDSSLTEPDSYFDDYDWNNN